MSRTITLSAFAALGVATLVLGSFSIAHQDDPKVLDRRPSLYTGRGLSTATAATPSQLPGGSGPAYLSFASSGIRLMSWLSLQDLNGGDNGNSLWGYTSPSGREYACFGSYLGTHFVEVTNPSAPVIVGFTDGPDSLWRDVRTYSHYAYSVSEGGSGIQITDLNNIDSGVVTYVGAFGQLDATHSMTIDVASGFLYRSGGAGTGIRIYSLANPASPMQVASWSTRYCHEATVITYTSGPYAGKQIAFLCTGDNGGWSNAGIDILDVTNKSNLIGLSHLNYTGAQYSHQCWPTDDRQYLYLDDELDEYYSLTTTLTLIFDISNLSNPIQLPGHNSGNTAIGHNLYVKSNRLYEANYTSGLHVLDISTPTAPVEVAWFDTYPENDGNTFNSLWNVYAYFNSGTIIGSDIDRGLFVWWVGAPLVSLTPASTPSVVQAIGQTVDVTLTEANAGDYVAGTASLRYYTDATGWQSSPLASLGGSNYRATFPALPCGTSVQWYLSAQSTNGFTWTEPAGAPGVTYVSTSAISTTPIASYDFETSASWVSGFTGDNATSGLWLRGDPHSTTSAQTEDDHTDPSYQCWYTGDGQDVDGGKTTLVSPTLNLSAATNPHIRYWRWFSNESGGSPGVDVFKVEISNNNGTNWSTVETVGPTGAQSTGGWYLHQFRVADIVAPTSQVKLRFVAQDLSPDSEIEAAVDDVEVFSVSCSQAPVAYCTAKLNSQGCSPAIGFTGTASATSASPFDITATNVINQKSGLMYYGFAASSIPFQGGFKCAQPPTIRTPLQLSGGNALPDDCSGTFSFDFNAYTQSGSDPNLVAGGTVYSQYWYRDGAASFGTGLTNALQFTIGL